MRSSHTMAFSGFSRTVIGAAVALLVAGPALAQTTTGEEGQPRAKDDNVRLGTITIVGEGGKLGAGQMLNEVPRCCREFVRRECGRSSRQR